MCIIIYHHMNIHNNTFRVQRDVLNISWSLLVNDLVVKPFYQQTAIKHNTYDITSTLTLVHCSQFAV